LRLPLQETFTFKISFMNKNFLKEFAGFFFPAAVLIILVSFISKNVDTKTVTGEILDMKCYMASGAHGDSHKDCADMCLKGGSPMGILAEDDKVYLLIQGKDAAPYEEARKHGGEMMIVTGALSEKNGVQALIVSEVKPKK